MIYFSLSPHLVCYTVQGVVRNGSVGQIRVNEVAGAISGLANVLNMRLDAIVSPVVISPLVEVPGLIP